MSGKAEASGTAVLAQATAALSFGDLPDEVVARTEDLFLDWLACAIAGGGERPAEAVASFAISMGPGEGPSELFGRSSGTSPFFAALANGTASHCIEQDDVHNASVLHPGTVVFPAVLAAAQAEGADGPALITAAVAGYEVGVRVARFLGASHYRVFHTTGTAGTLAAAAGVASVLELDAAQTAHALGSAGTQAAGLWEFLADGADSKALHAGKAAADGLLAAYTARAGLTGAGRILEGQRGMRAGMLADGDAVELRTRWGAPWVVPETSLKHHASCRHTHPAADALLGAMSEAGAGAGDVLAVRCGVHQAAMDVTWPDAWPVTPHQAKFSLPFVLALAAVRGHVRVDDFAERDLEDPLLRAFAERVSAAVDAEVEAAYPARWIAKVQLELTDGSVRSARIDDPRGDPGNPLTRKDIAEKLAVLARWSGRASEAEVARLAGLAGGLRTATSVRGLVTGDARPAQQV